MADSVKKQQGRTGKPGRPKGSTTKKETTAGNSRKRSTASGTKRSSSRQAPEPVYEEDDMGFMRAGRSDHYLFFCRCHPFIFK